MYRRKLSGTPGTVTGVQVNGTLLNDVTNMPNGILVPPAGARASPPQNTMVDLFETYDQVMNHFPMGSFNITRLRQTTNYSLSSLVFANTSTPSRTPLLQTNNEPGLYNMNTDSWSQGCVNGFQTFQVSDGGGGLQSYLNTGNNLLNMYVIIGYRLQEGSNLTTPVFWSGWMTFNLSNTYAAGTLTVGGAQVSVPGTRSGVTFSSEVWNYQGTQSFPDATVWRPFLTIGGTNGNRYMMLSTWNNMPPNWGGIYGMSDIHIWII